MDAATLAPQRITLGDGKTIDLKLPAGVDSGTQMRLTGKGEPGAGGAGDATVTVEVGKHPFFVRDGDNVRLNLPISLKEAVAGASVRVPTVDGPVSLNVAQGVVERQDVAAEGPRFPQEGRRAQWTKGRPTGHADGRSAGRRRRAGELRRELGRWGREPAREAGRLGEVHTISPESPEKRAERGETIKAKRFAKLRPGGYPFEVLKRVGIGVYSDGFIHAGNLAYLALVSLFPFFIVAAAVASLFGQAPETQRAVASFLYTLPPSVGELLRKPILDVLVARTGSLLWLGALVGLWTVGSFIETIRDVFRRAYGTEFSRPFWHYRLGSVLVIVGSVVLALVSFALQGVLTAAEQFVYRLLPFAEGVGGWIGWSRIVPGGGDVRGAVSAVLFGDAQEIPGIEMPEMAGCVADDLVVDRSDAGLPAVLATLGGYDLTYGSLAGVIVTLFFFFVIGPGHLDRARI